MFPRELQEARARARGNEREREREEKAGKERAFGAVKLERGAVRTFESCYANIILILFAEGGETGKFPPHFAVVRNERFPLDRQWLKLRRRETQLQQNSRFPHFVSLFLFLPPPSLFLSLTLLGRSLRNSTCL